ncbi:MAG: PEP-CTERM system TPR-repeat protein PrsT [Candidatus Rifleibacteriota bacterium]
MIKPLRFLVAITVCAAVVSGISGCGGKPKKKDNPVSSEISASKDSESEFSIWEKNAEIRAAIENGEIENAKSQIMQRLSSNPQDARAHFLLGKCYLEEKNFNEARKSLQTALELEPKNRSFSRELGRCFSGQSDELIANGMPSEAIVNLKKAMKYGYQPGETDEKLANAYRLTAKQLMDSGNTEEAEAILREALNLVPDRPDLRVQLSNLLVADDRLMEAERLLKSLSETNPDYVPGLIAYTRLLQRIGEYSSAALIVEKALAIEPANSDAMELKAAIQQNVPVITPPATEQLTPEIAREKLVELNRNGKLLEQKKILQSLLAQFPDESWAYLNLSELNEKLELYDEALENVRSYLQANPDSSPGNFQLARILRQKGDYEEALNIFNKLSATFEDKASLLNEMGQVYARMGRFDEARASWAKALEIDPEHAGALFSSGQLEMETGNKTAAQEYFEKAIRIEPFNAKYRYFAGLNLIQSGLKDQATAFWRSSIEYLNDEDPYTKRIISALGDQPQPPVETSVLAVQIPASVVDETPENPDYTQALNYARSGNFAEAIAGFKKVLAREPNNFNALMNLGKVYSASGDAAQSCALYLKALKIDPKNIFALKALANSYAEIGLHRFASEITNQARASYPGQIDGFPSYKVSAAFIKNNPRAYKPLVKALLKENLDQEALAVVQAGLAEQSDSVELLLLQGEVYKELGLYETALKSYQKAVELEPQNPDPYVGKGDLLVAAGQFTNAIEEYRKALKAGFIGPDTMFEIVDRFKQLGREADAQRVLGRLKGMNLNQKQMAKLEAHLGPQTQISKEENQ